jgi:uncharacterized membrane protein YdjX (TVP38/TMEM64 family)
LSVFFLQKRVLCRTAIPWWSLLAIVATLLWSWASHGIVFDLTRPDWQAAQRMDRLKSFFLNCGPWAPLAYVGFVTVEVVIAPIPGLLLYAPGGLIFGPVMGGLLAVLGNTLGAGLACLLTRSLNPAGLRKLGDLSSTSRWQAALEHRGAWLVFLLRLNPLTSCDLLSYAAGLTRIPVWQVMLATGSGMAPLCFGQSWLSDRLLTAVPQLIYPLMIAGAAYLVAVAVVVRRLLRDAVN